MPILRNRRHLSRLSFPAAVGCVTTVLFCASVACAGQTSSPTASAPLPGAKVSANKARAADDAYLAGARELSQNDLPAAEHDFVRALQLDPGHSEYIMSLAVTREHELSDLVRQAARAHLLGHDAEAAKMMAKAKTIDPENIIFTEHAASLAQANLSQQILSPPDHSGPPTFYAGDHGPHLAGAIEFAPTAAPQNFHHNGDSQDLLRTIYSAFGIKVVFDPSVGNQSFSFDLENVDFNAATQLVSRLTHTFSVPIDSKTALIAKDTADNRDHFAPLLEETIAIPGVTADQLTEYSTLVRNIYNPKVVSTQLSGGRMILRGEEANLNAINATLADLINGQSDVLLELHLYEIDRTHTQDIGAALPGSAGVYSVAAELQTIVSQNQALVNQLISSGVITLPGNYFGNLFVEAAALLGSGAVSVPQYSNLLGLFGYLGKYTDAAGTVFGVPLAGLYLGGSSTFNLLLNSSDVRALEELQMRIGDRQTGNFRSGTRYPIVTATYSTPVSSALASALGSAAIGNSTVASLLAQFTGGASQSTPQFQYEDLGITLKVVPTIQRDGNVAMTVDLKIESLAGGTINSIPILNNRSLTSTLSVPRGQTAMLATVVSASEMRAAEGLPGLSELPGFQGTDQNTEKDSNELLITLTPHIVREKPIEISSRAISVTKGPAEF